MGLVNMDEMLQSAKHDGRAVGAFNVLDYNSMRAVVQAAEDLESPVIVQTSVKTVEFWGASAMVDWARELAGRSRSTAPSSRLSEI
jgi:fructose/tagatose bisphosphate aldolase